MRHILSSIENRNVLSEASFEGDSSARLRAKSFVTKLHQFVSKHPDFLTKNNKGYSVVSDLFWNDPLSHGLTVLFIPKGAGEFGIGKSVFKDVMQLPILSSDLSIQYLTDRISSYSKNIAHEVIHWIDKGRDKSKGPDVSSANSYYNHPAEWNAFFQEGAYAVENLLDNYKDEDPERRKKIFKTFVGDGSFKDLEKNTSKFWDKNFLNSMDNKNKIKFNKRLYQFWYGIKEELK